MAKTDSTEDTRVEIFKELIKREPTFLDLPREELEVLAFAGEAAVAAYQTIVDQLKRSAGAEGLGARDRKTLEDAQHVAEMRLYVQAALGSVLKEEAEQREPQPRSGEGKYEPRPDGPAGPDGSKLTRRQRRTAETIADNPQVVQEVIEQAKANEDLPTKNAVVSRVASRHKAEEDNISDDATRAKMGNEAFDYLRVLESVQRKVSGIPKVISAEAWDHIEETLLDLRQDIDNLLNAGRKMMEGESDG